MFHGGQRSLLIVQVKQRSRVCPKGSPLHVAQVLDLNQPHADWTQSRTAEPLGQTGVAVHVPALRSDGIVWRLQTYRTNINHLWLVDY